MKRRVAGIEYTVAGDYNGAEEKMRERRDNGGKHQLYQVDDSSIVETKEAVGLPGGG